MQMVRTLASRAVTVNELAESFAITRRQVYRDLDRLSLLKIVLSFLPPPFSPPSTTHRLT
jgi:predicted DNA-binding transcriptional regulator YafY